MPSKSIDSKIENYTREYEGSLRERQDIKDAYIKCVGNIPKILKHIISAYSQKSNKRITNIIHQMIENGEVVKFSEMQTIAEKKHIHYETPNTTRLNNMSISSRTTEQTDITINTEDISNHPIASSTPFDISTDSFSGGPHLGIQDLLQMYPGYMNDSRSTANTNCETVVACDENLPSTSSGNVTGTDTYECVKCDTPNKRKYTKQIANPKKLKLDDSVVQNKAQCGKSTEEILPAITAKHLNCNKDESKVLKRTMPMKNKKNIHVHNDGLNTRIATSQNKIGDIHMRIHSRKQDIPRNKPGPSQKLLNANKMEISSTDSEVRLITEKLNTANLNHPNNEMRVTKGINIEALYAAETVMYEVCSGMSPSLNSGRNQSTRPNRHLEETLASKEQFKDQSRRVKLVHDIHLTPVKTNGVHDKSKSNSSIENQSKSSKQEGSVKKKLKTSKTQDGQSNINETEFPIDLSRKSRAPKTGRKVLSTSSKLVKETSAASNSKGNKKKELQDNNPTTSVKQKEINEKQLVQDRRKPKDLDKPGTSNDQNKNYASPKTVNKVKIAPLDGAKLNNTTMEVDEISYKISSKIVSKSVCSKEELSPSKSFKAKKEKMRNIENCLLLIRDLFSKYIKYLPDAEKKFIKKFNDADNKCQCICLELLTSQDMWHNIFNFSQKVRPDMEHSDIFEMATAFRENEIIDLDYHQEHEVVLLNQLSKDNLIKICDDLEKEGLNIYNKNKPDEKLNKTKMIENIQKNCNTQSKINLLRKKIHNRMGMCMRINKNFQQAFYSIYLLGTYTNPRFLKMQDYFKSMLMDKVLFTKYAIDSYTIFNSWSDFISYSKAMKYSIDFKDLTNDVEELGQICRKVFTELKIVRRRNESENFEEAPHLIQFTARAVYVNILTDASDTLLVKYPERVKEWLEYMIQFMKKEFPQKIGCWYYNLTLLHMKYLRPSDYGRISQLITKVLDEEKNNLSDVQLHRIYKIGRQVIRKKSEIFPMERDCIVERLPKSVAKFPEISTDPKSGISNRDYYTGLLRSAWSGEKIVAAFTLFFFDIIYTPKKFIPGAFVSNIQSEPLDMNTPYFYLNRKDEIDQRLREMEKEWSDDIVISFLKKKYDMHSHEFALCKIGDIIKDTETLKNMVQGFGRHILAKICKRLAENFAEHRIGFPNLLISYREKKKYFRAIKRFKDELTIEELLWLDYLRSNGAEVEIVRTPPCEYKKNVKKITTKDLLKPSTSSSSDKMT